MPTEIGKITTLKDTSGNVKFPRTVGDAITMEDGNTLTEVINDIYQLLHNLYLNFSFNFSNENSASAYGTLVLNSLGNFANGEYDICWGNNNGKLEEYKPITSFTLIGGNITKTYEFIKTNVIPKEATKILAIKDNEIKAEYIIPSNKLNTDTKLYTIGLLSDIHIDVTDDQSDSVSDFTKAIDRFKRENAIAICCTGDTVVDGSRAETEKFIELKNSAADAGIPMYIARGNHDCRDYTKNNWTTLVQPNGIYFEKEIGGDIYLFMGLNAENYTNNIFTTAQLDWLEQRLEYYKTKRVFLFEHVFIEPVGNVNSLYPWSSMGNTEEQPAKRFRDLMKKYRNVILFTGHSHLEFILQRLASNANCSERTDVLCHRVHIPSCAQPRANDESTEDIKANTYAKYGSSEGYVMDVYEDYIILKGINFVEDKYLPLAQYRINTTPILIDDSLLFYLDSSNPENTTSLIKDLSGKGNHFKANNIKLENNAIIFNGKSYLNNETLQPISTINDGSFSVEFVAECSLTNNSSNSIISIGNSKPGRIVYRMNCVNGNDDIYAECGSSTSVDLTSTNKGTIETDFNKKHHIIIVKENNIIKTYLDGNLNKSVTLSVETTTIDVNPRVTIGSKYNQTNNFFSGKLYMCNLYNKALTAEEVKNKYDFYNEITQ